MDFFASQEQARRKTGLLVVYFLLAVVLITFGVNLVATLVVRSLGAGTQGASASSFRLWNPALLTISSAITLMVIVGGSIFEVFRLGRGGGAMVAERLGGRLVSPGAAGLAERRLLNVVEEMAIASGVPTPSVYVMDEEDAINAFAAGYHASDAVIGITRGTLDLLDRDELQGVIGHEFSHILNGDMRLNIRLMGIVFGILMLTVAGQMIVRSMGRTRVRSRGGKGGGAVAAVFLAGLGLMIIGYVGVFFGRLIKAAISRQREFLADAASVQFTRNPDGLAGALRKIGGLVQGALIATPRVEDASHMFFGQACRMSFARMMATHPPLEERILRIDPSFAGEIPSLGRPDPPRQGARAAGVEAAGHFAAPASAPARARRGSFPVRSEAVIESIGAPMRRHIDAARHALAALPGDVLAACRDSVGARGLVHALLLDARGDIRDRQFERLRQNAEPGVLAATQQLSGMVAELAEDYALPLVDLCIPALKTLSEPEYRAFRANVEALAAADEEIDLFEYTLHHSLVRNLEARFDGPRTGIAQIYALRGLVRECSIVLSTLARFGHDDASAAGKAFAAAVAELREPKTQIAFAPPELCALRELDACLDRLAIASPQLKKRIVAACLQCLVHDGRVTVEEAELFRAVSYALDVPVPFFCGIAV
jgi:Zn-dependent protease with chaperone function